MTAATRIEIDERVNDGITVTLLWRPFDDTTWLQVVDAKVPSEGFTREVPTAEARQAFIHPFAYAPVAA